MREGAVEGEQSHKDGQNSCGWMGILAVVITLCLGVRAHLAYKGEEVTRPSKMKEISRYSEINK